MLNTYTKLRDTVLILEPITDAKAHLEEIRGLYLGYFPFMSLHCAGMQRTSLDIKHHVNQLMIYLPKFFKNSG